MTYARMNKNVIVEVFAGQCLAEIAKAAPPLQEWEHFAAVDDGVAVGDYLSARTGKIHPCTLIEYSFDKGD